jgi:hypothetical protein
MNYISHLNSKRYIIAYKFKNKKINYVGKSKSNGTPKKHTDCKYTETKLILLFNVIPLNYNAPVPAFHKFFFNFFNWFLQSLLHLGLP